MEADRRGSAFGIDSTAGTEAMRTTKRQEARRVASKEGPRLFRAKNDSPDAPQHAGFGLGPPAPISARAGEKRAPGGVTGPIFWRRRSKNRLGGLVGGAAGDALRTPDSTLHPAYYRPMSPIR